MAKKKEHHKEEKHKKEHEHKHHEKHHKDGHMAHKAKVAKQFMDKEIRRIEKGVKHTGKDLKKLEKADKKRDNICDYGEKMLKKKK